MADAAVEDSGAGARRDAEPSADAGAVNGKDAATASPPTFQKTRCIDPGMVEPGTELDFPCDAVDLWVALPKQCTTHRCGLIFNIHGGGMTDHATMDQATNMISLGNQADYVVVHPHKGTGTWDTANDKTPMFDFLQQVIVAFGIDPKRVHSTGYSQGAQISWALGCEHAEVLASIAPAEEINRVSDCWQQGKLPSRELSILYAYGKQDTIGGGYDAATSLANDIASAWKMSGPETIAGSEGSNYWRQRWTTAKGTAFEFISHNYTSIGVGGILAGHCLPMSSGTTFVNCLTPVDYDWGQEVVRFFQAHPMQ
jgi:pimeloyl-ACP methyl ester carboxylesterase